jgi:leucyl-tRNA synthetase
MLSRLQECIEKATESMEKLEMRRAIQTILFQLDQDLQWYRRRTKAKRRIILEVLKNQILMLTPFAPHVCEELWEIMGCEGFISIAPWPKPDKTKVDLKAEESENLVRKVLEDTRNIIRATKAKPRKVFYYIAAPWKWRVYIATLKKSMEGKITLSALMRELMQDPELKAKAKEVADFASKVIEEANQMPQEEKRRLIDVGQINEKEILEEAENFLKCELNAEIAIFEESSPERYDPKNKAHLAKPLRPAIYVES